MKFSIITPEHDPNVTYLMDLYDSLIEQTYTNWEWILYLNGNCKPEHIPEPIRMDNRVFIHLAKEPSKFIGHIKNRSFKLGTGDILVEVDHDDMLTPDCLQELVYAFQDPEVGFVYSNNAVLHMEDKFVPYDQSYGWTYETFNWKGKELIAMNSWEPTSHALGYIWFSPDHVRAWRTSEYQDRKSTRLNSSHT